MKTRFLSVLVLIGASGLFLLYAAGPSLRPDGADKVQRVDQTPPKVDPTRKIAGMTAVPDLTGMAEGVEVAKTLDKAGLKVGSVTYDATPAGWRVRVVLSQEPAAGRFAPRNSTVDLVVTLGPAGGPRDVRVPEVVGRPLSEATASLEGAGLFADVRSASGRTIPSVLVGRQDPVPGRTLRVGSRVTLTASSDVLVPNVVGLTEARAMGAITAGGLRQGSVARVPAGDREPAGVVRTQTPGAGSRVRLDSAVDVVLTVEAKVPRLAAMTEPQARTVIERMGLVVGEVTYREMPGYFREGVVDQAPPPDNPVRRGTRVNFTVGIFIPREIVFKSVHVTDDTDSSGSGEIWVRATVNGTPHIIGGNLAIESGGFANLDYRVSLPALPLPPPDRWTRLRVEARDDDSGFAWANVFERGEYESLGTSEEVMFPRHPVSDTRANMFGKGTNTIAGAKFRVVFEIR
jgi:beta-lactam-binding protein with PASTA domain